MRKIALLLFATIFATSAFAQQWSAGIRVGSGIQAVGQYHYNDKNYFEVRLGGSWNNEEIIVDEFNKSRMNAEISIMHNWRLLDMDWTPDYGTWFVDAGVGINGGGRKYYGYGGVMGSARLGFTFFDVPLTVSVDWSPSFGIYNRHIAGHSKTDFNSLGIANLGITCVYNF